MLNRTVVLVALAALALPACKKTVEGESKRWSSNTQKVKELSALYPGFSAPLKAQLAQAEKAMAAAKEVGDKEASAKAMAAANSMLSSGFIGKLKRVDSKIKSLRAKATKVMTSIMPAGMNFLVLANRAPNTARRATNSRSAT